MDEDFIRGRAEHIRELATKADPFTKKRLLDLADTYDRRPYPTRRTSAQLQQQVKR